MTLPAVASGCEHVYHLYVICHERRDALAQYLKSEGIQTNINYPVALPFLPAYEHFGHRAEDFPVAHRNQSRILSLPIFREMNKAQIDRVVVAIESFARIPG